MTRAQRFATVASILSALYILTYLAILPVPLLADDTKNEILPVVSLWVGLRYSLYLTTWKIPWWLLVSFGAYSLGSLGWGLFTFRDCPEAYQELLAVSRSPHSEIGPQ